MWKSVFVFLSVVFAVSFGGMVGGLKEIDVADEGVINATNFAVVQHNKASNDVYVSQVVDVVRIQRQVVAGFKYFITVKMARTTCRKGNVTETCAFQQELQPYQCRFVVWVQPWNHFMKLTEETCQ